MNRKSWAALLVILCVLIPGCGQSAKHPSSITFDDLPSEIAYDDTSISLDGVSFCEVYADHGYIGYCVVTVDRTSLTDDNVYWMLNKEIGEIQAELEVNAYFTSEINSLESERMSQLGISYTDENIFFVFCTEDVQREQLNDFELSLQIIMSPEKNLTADTTQYYYFYLKGEENVNYFDYNSVLSEDEINALLDALNSKIDSLS